MMDSSNTQRRLRILRYMIHLSGLCGFTAICLIAWWFLIRPIDHQRRFYSQRMSQLKATLAAADEIQSEYTMLSQRLAADRDREASLQARIPDDPAEAEFLALASKLATETGLKIKDYRPGQPVQESSCSSLGVELICEGDFASVCGFLDGMSKLPRLSKIKRLHIDATETKHNTISEKMDYLIEITVLLYFAARSDDAPLDKGDPHA